MFTLERRNFPSAHQTLASISWVPRLAERQRDQQKESPRGAFHRLCVYEFISGGGYLFQQQVQSEELSLVFTAELKNVMSVGGQGLFFVFRSGQTGIKTHSLVFGFAGVYLSREINKEELLIYWKMAPYKLNSIC